MKFIIPIFAALLLIPAVQAVYAQGEVKMQPENAATAASAVPELDRFHKILHPLVHDAQPANDYTTIRKAVPRLLKTATALSKVSLPKAYASSQGEFRKASKKLVAQLRDLNKRKGRLSDKDFGVLFSEMHDTFEGMMGMVR